MITFCLTTSLNSPMFQVDYACTATVTGVYTVYGVVELCAWLSDAKVLSFESAKLWRWCLYLWIVALLASIIKQVRLKYDIHCKQCFIQIRIITKKCVYGAVDKSKEDIISLVGLSSDFIAAINSLPFKVSAFYLIYVLFGSDLSPLLLDLSICRDSIITFSFYGRDPFLVDRALSSR